MHLLSLVFVEPTTNESAKCFAVPPEAACEDAMNILWNSVGRPVSFHASLNLLVDCADAALGGGGYVWEARADDDMEKVGRLSELHRFVDEISQVRLAIA